MNVELIRAQTALCWVCLAELGERRNAAPPTHTVQLVDAAGVPAPTVIHVCAPHLAGVQDQAAMWPEFELIVTELSGIGG